MASLTQPVVRVRQETHVRTTQKPGRFDGFKLATYVFLSCMAVIYIAPLVWMVLKSTMDVYEANSTALFPTRVYFVQNYGYMLTQGNFLRYVANTLVLEVLTVSGQTIISLLAAYGFSRLRFPGRDLLFSIFLITIFIPITVTLVPKLVIVTNISRFFERINPALRWINNWPALVMPFLASTFGIFLLRQFFMQVPEDLWDAARIDGSGHLRYLFTILVPISRAAVITTVLFSFIGTWSALEWPILVTSDDQWKPIGVALYTLRSQDQANQTQLLMAGSVIALLPILILYFIAQKQFTEGIATTGLKG